LRGFKSGGFELEGVEVAYQTASERSRGLSLAGEVMCWLFTGKGILTYSPSIVAASAKVLEESATPDVQCTFALGSFKGGQIGNPARAEVATLRFRQQAVVRKAPSSATTVRIAPFANSPGGASLPSITRSPAFPRKACAITCAGQLACPAHP
jgi:hypothetical protein